MKTLVSFHQKIMRLAFRGSLLIKGFYAILETIAGFVILFIPYSAITTFATYLSNRELASDPNDEIFRHLSIIANEISISGQHFAGTFLMIHGAVKVFVVISLLRNKKWAFLVAFVVFSFFVLYEIYRYTHTHAQGLLIVAAFDILIVILMTYDHYFSKIPKKTT